jgi:hypothetical protein
MCKEERKKNGLGTGPTMCAIIFEGKLLRMRMRQSLHRPKDDDNYRRTKERWAQLTRQQLTPNLAVSAMSVHSVEFYPFMLMFL